MEVTRLSDVLFGRSCRVPLAIWIMDHPKGRFFQSEAPREVIGPTAARQELARFVEIGLVEVERPDGDKRVFYVRTNSPLWQIIETTRALLE